MAQEQTITLPLWIVQKAISALGLTVSSIPDECCLKRQCASAANYLKLCLEKPDATDEDFASIAGHYLGGKTKGVVVQIGKNDALIIEDESQDWRHSQRHVTWMNRLGKNWYYVNALRDLKQQASEEDVKLVESYMQ